MTPSEFSAILKARFEKTRNLLDKKGKEYAREDRLSNFKKAAALMGVRPEGACFGFLAKHLVSIADLVGDLEGGLETPMPVWEEKIGDAVAYLILLEALVTEQRVKTISVTSTK